MTRADALQAILTERARQEKLKREGRFRYTCADSQPSLSDKLAILTEEVGEAAKAINDCDIANLKEEVTQCAAVCLAWLESL